MSPALRFRAVLSHLSAPPRALPAASGSRIILKNKTAHHTLLSIFSHLKPLWYWRTLLWAPSHYRCIRNPRLWLHETVAARFPRSLAASLPPIIVFGLFVSGCIHKILFAQQTPKSPFHTTSEQGLGSNHCADPSVGTTCGRGVDLAPIFCAAHATPSFPQRRPNLVFNTHQIYRAIGIHENTQTEHSRGIFSRTKSCLFSRLRTCNKRFSTVLEQVVIFDLKFPGL